MIPIIFQIGPFKIYSFGLMLALGFLVTGYLLRKELGRSNISPKLGDSIVIGALGGGLVGAKLYSVIESLIKGADELGTASLSLRTFFSGSGWVWYGGFAGGTIAVLMIIWRSRVPMMKVIDLIAPLLILGYAFGRMGCFLSGDGDYGPPTNLPWGMAFPNGIVPTFPGERVHPTPLYEIALLLMIFVFLWKMRRRSLPTGWMFGMYLILAGAERFVTEFWRLTPVVALGMTMAQIISIVLMIIGIAMTLYLWKAQAMTNGYYGNSKSKAKI
jgi:phosphatidylglycerol:prolipoprotein diacylglycerol transferase